MPDIGKRGRPFTKPRTRANGKAIPPVWAGQVDFNEDKALNKINADTGRSKSEIVRRALQRLIADNAAGKIDWSRGADPVPTIKGK